MSESNPFRALILKVRASDEAAATELVRRYEPALRRTARMYLTDPHLRRDLDSGDVCQSVLKNFFVRVTAGQFDLDSPEQLGRLLARMALNNVRSHLRKLHAKRHPPPSAAQPSDDVPDSDETPSQIASNKELLQLVRQGLTEEERYLMDQRRLGWEWVELAKELGLKPDALRIKLTRGLNRVARRLGLDKVTDE